MLAGRQNVHGILNLNKPSGITSHDLVQLVRRHLPGVKAGHAGTLDPEATGVLPVCCGKATRLVEYLMDLPKGYLATVALGVTTDTGDAVGRVLEEKPVLGVGPEQIEAVLSGLRGAQEQLAHPYSAVKYRGKPLYYWTRRGVAVPRRARRITIDRLELTGFLPGQMPQLKLKVECSRGTYIRVLAEEIGCRLGCGAHLVSLVRTFVGPFRIDESFGPEELRRAVDAGCATDLLFPLERALAHLLPVTLEPKALRSLAQGKKLRPTEAGLERPQNTDGELLRVHDIRGRFRAIACWKAGTEGPVLKTVKFIVWEEVDDVANEAD